jgi:hypothetical protein
MTSLCSEGLIKVSRLVGTVYRTVLTRKPGLIKAIRSAALVEDLGDGGAGGGFVDLVLVGRSLDSRKHSSAAGRASADPRERRPTLSR